MRKYLITIINLRTGRKTYLDRDESTYLDTIKTELGGYNAVKFAQTSNSKVDSINWQQAGTTNDGTKMYSILCYNGDIADNKDIECNGV